MERKQGYQVKERYQVTFRLSLEAYTRLEQVAELHLMRPSQYAKARLLVDLGLIREALDRRRREHRERR